MRNYYRICSILTLEPSVKKPFWLKTIGGMFQNRVDNEWKRISYSQNEPNPYQFIQRSEYLSLIKLKKDNQYFREISNPILKNIGGDKYYETLIRAFKDLSVSIDHKQNQLLKDAVNNQSFQCSHSIIKDSYNKYYKPYH